MKISPIATGIKYVFLKFNLSPYTDLEDRQFKSLTEMKSRSLPIFHRARKILLNSHCFIYLQISIYIGTRQECNLKYFCTLRVD